MHKIVELFGINTAIRKCSWRNIIHKQFCPYSNKRCYKIRKSQPDISIGTCTVLHGEQNNPIIICPKRLLQNQKVFMDCIHLLLLHQPGNDIHVVSEISVPGGNIDYILASVNNGKVIDFVGIEFQTLDTTGTLWTERQKFLNDVGVSTKIMEGNKNYGMNWKMTAKTILIQLHHKIDTFEYLRKQLVLVIQNDFLDYVRKEFDFEDINNPALIGDSMHIHSYSLLEKSKDTLTLQFRNRISTNSEGLAKCLGLNAEAKVELTSILHTIEQKISSYTLLKIH
jgi:hypothetical protein